MRILILATPRSGSSAMHTATTKAYGLWGYSEPFNHQLQQNWTGNQEYQHLYDCQAKPFDVPDGFIVKALGFFNHWPDVYYKHWEGGLDHYVNVHFSENYQVLRQRFFQRYVQCFDRALVLLRRDVGAQLRSMLIGHQRDRTKGEQDQSNWWGKYKAFDPVLDKEGALNARLLFDSIRLIENVAAHHDLPILYYEDLFTNQAGFNATNAKHDLGLEDMWADHFNPQKKWAG
ncbi:MAG: hypothetical protein AAF386_03170 [Pseudomonadota bacterium]